MAEVARIPEQPVKILELSVPADDSQLSRVRDFVVDACQSAGLSLRETNNTKLAVDEACTNIIKHAYVKQSGDIKIRAEIFPDEVQITLHDTGEHFDFASIEDPDLDEYVESGKKGGLGVYLINRLMDTVEYHAIPGGNELVLTKKGQAAAAKALPGVVSWRNSLRFKFTLRAALGLFILVTAIWAFIFVRQTGSINDQRNMQWVEKKRIAANLASRSKDLLLQPEAFSVEQTNLGVYLAKLLSSDNSLAYVRVLDPTGKILSSGNVDEIFSQYQEPESVSLLTEESGVAWTQMRVGGQAVRNIFFPVVVRSAESEKTITLGGVHVGVYENAVEGAINDPRFSTALLIIGILLVGVLLIMGLVSVFVRPIQVLTDGVRAIGEGALDGEIAVHGPAEIGAIAAVFNEITQKFKKAQESVLEQEKLQKEMEVAKQIQHSLLPKRLPDVSGYDIAPYYQAAAEVGGDYYDFVQVDDDTVGIVVADVSGKGVPGSLVMTMIRTALRMEARGNKNASDVMAKMNDFVTDDMRKGMFVTMFYVILDSKNRIVSYASAGHNPMVLYRREANETYFLNPKGFPVGISLPDESLFRRSISLEKIKLKKDDMLLIYTDGVTEAMDPQREQYGEDRMLRLIKRYGHLHPKEFISKLEADIRTFTGGQPQNDDITVVAIKEKLTADEVLSGLRKKLIDLVEVGGLSVKEACARMRVSPATYYRYKKRLEMLGERGLKDKILRQDVELRRVSLEDRQEIIAIIQRHPEYGAKRITAEFNTGKDPNKKLTVRMVYDELKRLGLNTKQLRLDYLRRHRLLDEEELREKEKEMVEELLREVTAAGTEAELAREKAVAGADADQVVEFEAVGDLAVSFRKADGDVTVLQIEGHLDSVSSSSLEKKLKEMISGGNFKIAVDLSRVSYVSSGGWGIFAGEVRRLRESGGDVVLVGMSSEVFDVYDLLGFSDLLHAFPDMNGAIQFFRLPPEERIKAAKELAADQVTETPVLGPADGEVVEVIPGESYVPEWESLEIEATTVGDAGDIAVLSLRGIIDTVSAENLRRALDRVIASGRNKIVIDLSLIEYVSSGGWGAFTERLREVRRAGGDIKLFGMDADVYYVFTMLGFNIVLSSFDILADAIEDFKREPGRQTVVPGSRLPAEAPHGGEDMGSAEEDDRIARSEMDLEFDRRAPAGYDVTDARAREKLVSWEAPVEGVLISRLHGSIEASAVAILDGEIESHLVDQPNVVLFDLEDVHYASSAGWGLFAKCLDLCAAWGGIVALCSLNEDLYEIYQYLELQPLIPAYSSRNEALHQIEALKQKRAEASRPVEHPPRDEPSIAYGEPAVADREQPVEGEVSSVDDVLGREQQPKDGVSKSDLQETAGEVPSSDAGKGAWPEMAPRKDIPPEPEEPVSPASPPRPREDAPDQREDVVFEEEPHAVDVQSSATTDKHVAEDDRLRDMGWEKYGEELKRSLRRKKNKKENS
ncbi:MAG: anti-sigma factor antagonist [Candidatus Latescibacteria bacterium]|nr:anti-sigma factor antagonist [Candidatus Latescibacterota bacterium]NIM21632.1 anti-sigma factor antagonist [Candidatus Latescibacterota bacterium]NIM64611.1 anti-sigma factor antagonist [Candidatus Latescibacterota bacterium]NIO01126.1 anti-sigma factor antagonist [Candidatus Latescibacterota bacterium]NIO27519.1 anti-sigma factor antagonist [Candidatus Latescibacterota bacterium]